ncbi:putative arylesterase monoxygenase [Rosellinia necatrix]|uniref:Putative arylesterase monoxygenase n=1 Tax=Rosellinia necatrix TaxID=77044 RepID=A0A1W2TQF2_ROSNE|nr:putative arylesterase monoxygenase [Rosellinia necatrix]
MWLKTLKTRLKHRHEEAGDEEEEEEDSIVPTANGYVVVWDKTKRKEDGEPTITTEGALIVPRGSAAQRLQKTLRYDAEYAAWREPLGEKARIPPCETVLEFRQYNNALARAAWGQLPPEPTIQRVRYNDVVSRDGATIGVTRFVTVAQLNPVAAETKSSILRGEPGAGLPSLLYAHGGGTVAGSVEMAATRLARLAALSGVQVFGVEYRLAPEFPAPVPAEDCYAALTWLHAHAAELGLDRARIGVMGDGAGGGLAAATALLARDRGLNPPLKSQVLVSPTLDDRAAAKLVSSPSSGGSGGGGGGGGSPLLAFATMPLQNIRMCWRAYLGPGAGHSNGGVSPYAAPARASDLTGLPATYIDVGGLDLLRNECAEFAQRLVEADVQVEFHLLSGVPHGFESAGDIGIARRALRERIRWLRGL